jgi:molybdenum cofactor cytidylyltransferase
MIYGIILAAGESKRMGKVKLTLPLGDKQLIEWVLQAVKLTPLDKYFLVVRPEDKEIIKTGEKWGAEVVLNSEYRSGMSSSLKKALHKEMIVPFYKDRSGNPVFFDGYWKDELMKLSGDVGGRALIKAHPEKIKRINISDEAILFDIDEEKDYLKIQTYLKLLQNRKEN